MSVTFFLSELYTFLYRKQVKVKRIEPGNPQELDKWIRAISDLHRQTEHFFWLSRQNKIQKSTAKTKLGISYTIRAPPRHRYTVHVTL